MWRRYFLLLGIFIVFGEFAIATFLNVIPVKNPPYWAMLILPAAFSLSFVFYVSKGIVGESLKRYITLESLFILGMIVYLSVLFTTKVHALVTFGYFMIYMTALCACFIFRDFASYLYLLASALLIGITQIYEPSMSIAALFLALLIFCITFHNDYMHCRGVSKYKLKKIHSPLLVTITCVIIALGLFTGMGYSTPDISSYIQQWMQKQAKSEKAQKQLVGAPSPKRSAQKSASNSQQKRKTQSKTNIPRQKAKNVKPPIERISPTEPKINFQDDLRFGNINLGNVPARVLFEVTISSTTRRKLARNNSSAFWKLGALDHYDATKGRWKQSDTTREDLENLRKTTKLSKTPRYRHLKVWQFYKLSPGVKRIFYLDPPQQISISSLWRDSGGNIYPKEGSKKFNNYQVLSAIPIVRNTSRLRIANAETRYLEPPLQFFEYRGLARRIARGAGSPFAQIKAIEQYLKNEYIYDLKPQLEGENDATYEFLFEKKRGYCQHFASAMVLLLRSLEIPARVAIGCKGGVWNARSSSYTVSSLHGHAWVEVKFANIGWYPFDPVADISQDLQKQFDKKLQNVDGLKAQRPRFKPNRNNKTVDNNKSQQNSTANGGNEPPVESQKTKQSNKSSKTKNNNLANNFPSNDKDKTQFLFDDNNKRKNAKNSASNNSSSASKTKNTRNVQKNNRRKQSTNNNKHKNRRQGSTKTKQRKNSQNSRQNRQQKNRPNNHKANNNFSEKDYERRQKRNSYMTKKANKTQTQNPFTTRHKKNAELPDGLKTFAFNMMLFFTSLGVIWFLYKIIPILYAAILAIIKEWKESLEEDKEVPTENSSNKIAQIFFGRNKNLNERKKIIATYKQLSKSLKKFKLSRSEFQTPVEYAEVLCQHSKTECWSDINNLTLLFIKARYSLSVMTKEEATQAEECVKRIALQVKNSGNKKVS